MKRSPTSLIIEECKLKPHWTPFHIHLPGRNHLLNNNNRERCFWNGLLWGYAAFKEVKICTSWFNFQNISVIYYGFFSIPIWHMRKPRHLQSVRNLPKIPQLGGRVRLKLIHSSLVSHWSPSSYPSAQYTVSVKKMSPHWQPQLLWRAMWHHLLHGKVGISLIQQFQIETIIFF